MMLRTYLNNKNSALNMFKFSFMKNLGITLLFAVVVLVICPGAPFVFLKNAENMAVHDHIGADNALRSIMTVLAVAAGAGVVIFNFINFTFLYSKKSSDVFHAFPLTRTELLLSRTASGFVSVLIPIIFSYSALFGFNEYFKAHFGEYVSFKTIFISFAFTIMAMLVASAISMLFVICAGTAFDFFVSIFAVNIGVLLIGMIIIEVLTQNLIGYVGDDITIFNNISPIFYMGYSFATLLDSGDIYTPQFITEYIIRTVIYTVVFFVLDIILYNKRKAEKGEEAYAYKFVYIVCSIIIAFCTGFVVGYLFSSGEYDVMFWIFAIIGGFFFAVVYGAISNRGFKTVGKFLINGAIGCALLVGVFVYSNIGGFGYTNYIPKADEIDTVTVSYDSHEIEFIDTELPIKFHQGIVTNKNYLLNRGYYEDILTNYVHFTYQLKNGKEVSRGFHVKVEPYANEFLELLKSEERIQALNEFFCTNTDSKELYLDNGSVIVSHEEALKLLELYKKELPNATKYSVLGRYEDDSSLTRVTVESQVAKYSYMSETLCLEPSFTESLEYLDYLKEKMDVYEYKD